MGEPSHLRSWENQNRTYIWKGKRTELERKEQPHNRFKLLIVPRFWKESENKEYLEMASQCSQPVWDFVTTDPTLESWAPLFLTWVTVCVAFAAPAWPSPSPSPPFALAPGQILLLIQYQPRLDFLTETFPLFAPCALYDTIFVISSQVPLEQRLCLSCPILSLQLLGENLEQRRGSVSTF